MRDYLLVIGFLLAQLNILVVVLILLGVTKLGV